jgi:glucose/arabinose dehydrogenase
MCNFIKIITFFFFVTLACSPKVVQGQKKELSQQQADTVQTAIGPLVLPPPYSSESVTNESKMVVWPEAMTPTAPKGFEVTKFAGDLINPRYSYVGPNGDLFVVESGTKGSANRITIFQDTNQDGEYETREIFLENLNQPFGMLILNQTFYVANTDGLYRFPYQEGQKRIEKSGQKILNLPAGGYNNHWTRNLIANADGTKIYVSVGSASNAGEYGMKEEIRRACILEINPDGTGEVIFASGLRNPVGMDWNPVSGELWTAVNERDKLGNDLVPDYVTSVKRNGFYGWPYSYFGQIPDPRLEGAGKELIEQALIPDIPVGNHTASLGLVFYDGDQFPEKYQNGAFVGQHGSWNRAELSGYKVIFIPFENGKPSGKPEDFLTGFIADREKSEVFGRPVGVTILPDGSLLVNDDSGNTLWKVSVNNSQTSSGK